MTRPAVREAAHRWRGRRDDTAFYEPATVDQALLEADEVMAAMPRPPALPAAAASRLAPRGLRLAAPFRASLWHTLGRLFLWLRAIARFLGGVLADKLRGRDSPHRRAQRLKATITRVGGTFIKIGQQASVRVDLLPQAYTEVLTSLLDQVDPFPTDQAVAAVERVTGRPLRETFAVFDPVPIGSASIACVYQAVLPGGERVAVKVRRPGVGRDIAADLRVVGWMSALAERLTLVRPGFTAKVLAELRTTLFDELDFYKEARFQEIFRRRARKARRKYFTAPRLYPELSGEDVIVEEYVSGIWLFELLAAVENRDDETLARLAELDIDPTEVARRLVWVSHWGLWDSVFFHGDPHPANIIVRRGNQLVFIDFGAMGSLPASRRASMREIFNLIEHEDLEGMARLSLTLLEPLPPIDTDEVIKAVEEVFWEALLAYRSKHSEWYERTTAQLWLGFFRVTSRFKIPMSYDTVRLIRATLLYDTLAARLDNDIDLPREYRRYRRDAGRDARKRVVRAVDRRADRGLLPEDWLRLEQLGSLGRSALMQADRLAKLRTFSFGAYVGKLVSSVVLAVGLVLQLGVVTLVAVGAVALFADGDAWGTVLGSWIYWVVIGGLGLIALRRIMFRLKDREL